jgi:hypothetical protein
MADLRRCIGSAKFGIEAHEAPVEDFPLHSSQKDGLGRMCKPHWHQYTQALGKAALARSDAAAAKARATKKPVSAEPVKKPGPIRTRPARGRKAEGEQVVEALDAADVEEASIS